jgi:hypothetical protein
VYLIRLRPGNQKSVFLISSRLSHPAQRQRRRNPLPRLALTGHTGGRAPITTDAERRADAKSGVPLKDASATAALRFVGQNLWGKLYTFFFESLSFLERQHTQLAKDLVGMRPRPSPEQDRRRWRRNRRIPSRKEGIGNLPAIRTWASSQYLEILPMGSHAGEQWAPDNQSNTLRPDQEQSSATPPHFPSWIDYRELKTTNYSEFT